MRNVRAVEIEVDGVICAKELETDFVAGRRKALIVTDTGASSS